MTVTSEPFPRSANGGNGPPPLFDSAHSTHSMSIVKLEPADDATTPYASLFTPWSTYLASLNSGSFPFPYPSPNSALQPHSQPSSSTSAGEPYTPWNPDESSGAGGITFGGTGFTPGWQMSGIFQGSLNLGQGQGQGQVGSGWPSGSTPESEKGLGQIPGKGSFVVKGEEGVAEFAKALENRNQRADSGFESQQAQSTGLGPHMRQGEPSYSGEVKAENAQAGGSGSQVTHNAARPAAIPLQVDTSEVNPSQNSSGFSHGDLTNASNGAARSTNSVDSIDTGGSRSFDSSVGGGGGGSQYQDPHLRRASHVPRHIVDLSAMEQQHAHAQQQQRQDQSQTNPAEGFHQEMPNYSGFTNPYQHYAPPHNPYMTSVDPMNQQQSGTYPSQPYYPSRSQRPSFIQMPHSTSDLRQSISTQDGSGVGGSADSQRYPYHHRDSRDSNTSSNGPSISPAVLSRPPSHGNIHQYTGHGSIAPAGQTNILLGSPVSVHSLPSDQDPQFPISRSNSDAGQFGRTVEGRAASPHRITSGGSGHSSARHPYIDGYNRRNQDNATAGGGGGSSTSPNTSPRAIHRKAGSSKPTKRSSMDQQHVNTNTASGPSTALGMTMDYSDDEGENGDIPEGIEKDGMMWGMKTEDYRALSARERKRVRNRISARTFRARRKEHLNDLESGMVERNAVLKDAQDTIRRLREENNELTKRLSKYETV